MDLSDKFFKLLTKFLKWANNHYIIKCKKTHTVLKWSLETPLEFTEPQRKKLYGYLKNIFNEYIIEDKNNIIITNYTFLITHYDESTEQDKLKKENKNDSKVNTKQYDQLLELNINKFCNEIKQNLYNQSDLYNNTDQSERISYSDIVKDDIDIVLHTDLDTSFTWFLSSLNFTSDELITILGNPLQTGKKNDSHRYEWKFTYNCCIYSIYDWKPNDMNTPFKNIKWYLGGDHDDKNNIKNIIDIISNKRNHL